MWLNHTTKTANMKKALLLSSTSPFSHESRDPWAGGQKIHFRNPRPRFTYSLCTFGGCTMNVIKVICENNSRPCVQKRHISVWACAKSRFVEGTLNVLLHSFSSTSIFCIGLQNLSIYSRLRPFSATFGLRTRRNGYLWTSGVTLDTAVRFPNPDFLFECKISANLAKFTVDFCILYSERPPYFCFRFVWPTNLESTPHASTSRW